MATITCEEQLAIEKYKLLFDLWMAENPVKTNKLQMLMATNSILASAFFLAGNSIWIALVGFFFSLVWVLSIGRTVAYQRHWKVQMEEVRAKHSANPLFQIHSVKPRPSIWGRIPSRYYLLGTPIVTALAWLAVILYSLIA